MASAERDSCSTGVTVLAGSAELDLRQRLQRRGEPLVRDVFVNHRSGEVVLVRREVEVSVTAQGREDHGLFPGLLRLQCFADRESDGGTLEVLARLAAGGGDRTLAKRRDA